MSSPQAPIGTADVAAMAEDLSAIRRRVLNVVGHELRTPAATLQGLAAQACEADDLREVTEEIGPALLRNADRLMALLDQLLVAAGIQTALPVGPAEAVDLADLLRSVWASVGSEGEHPDHELAVEGDATVQLPRAALVIALDAVLANARQYGDGPPTARVDLADATATIEVRSPGRPPHPEEVRLAAEPFFRGERAVTARPGLGLGLAIAKGALGHLGGDIRMTATEDAVVTTATIPTQPAP